MPARMPLQQVKPYAPVTPYPGYMQMAPRQEETPQPQVTPEPQPSPVPEPQVSDLRVPRVSLAKKKPQKYDYSPGAVIADNAKFAWDIVRSIPHIAWNVIKAPKDLYQGYSKVLNEIHNLDSETLKHYKNAVMPEIMKAGNDAWRGISSHWRDPETQEFTLESVATAPYRKFLPVMLDVLTLGDAAAWSGMKLSGPAAKIAAKTKGVDELAFKSAWESKFKALRNKPREWAAAGVNKVEQLKPIKTFEEWLNVTPAVRQQWRTLENIRMKVRGMAEKRITYLQRNGGVPKHELDIVDSIFAHETSDLSKLSPQALDFVEELATYQAGDFLDIKSGLLNFETGAATDALRRQAKIKKLSERTRRKTIEAEELASGVKLSEQDFNARMGGIYNKEDMSFAEQMMDANSDNLKMQAEAMGRPSLAAHVEDMFHPSVFKSADDIGEWMSNLLKPSAGRILQTATGHQRFLSGRGEIGNPNIWAQRYLRNNAKHMGLMRGVARVLRDVGHVSFGANDPLPAGYTWMPEPFTMFLKHQTMVTGILGRDLTKNLQTYMKQGVTFEEALARTMAEMGPTVDRMSRQMAKALGRNGKIAVPEGFAKALATETEPSGPWVRGYNKTLDGLREIWTTWSPKFYTANIMGNAIIQVLHGINPFSKTRGMDDIATEAARAMQTYEYDNALSNFSMKTGMPPIYSKVKSKLDQFNQWTDGLPRVRALEHMMSKEIKEHGLVQKYAQTLGDTSDPASAISRLMENAFKLREESLGLLGGAIETTGFEIEPLLQQAQSQVAKWSTDKKKATKGTFKAGFKKEFSRTGTPTGGIGPQLPQTERFTRATAAGTAARAKAAAPLGQKPKVKQLLQKSIAHNLRESLEKNGQIEAWLAKNGELVQAVEKSILDMENILGGYGKLTPFARKKLRAVIPFWTFQKTMYQMLFWMPLIRPKTSWLWSQAAQMAVDSMGEEGAPRDSMLFGYDGKKDRMIFFRVSGLNPFDMIARSKSQGTKIPFTNKDLPAMPGMVSVGGVPIPSIFDPMQNPLFSVMHDLVGGYDRFHNMEPVKPGDQILDSFGRVLQHNDNSNEWSRVSPQKPLVEALFGLLPQFGQMRDLMSAAGLPPAWGGKKVMTGPLGRPVQPMHWENAILKIIGINVQNVDMKQARVQQRLQVKRILRGLMKQAMMSKDPQERADIRKLVHDQINQYGGVKVGM